MDKYYEATHEFCVAMGQPVDQNINERTQESLELLHLRMKLIREEYEELSAEVSALTSRKFKPYSQEDGSFEILTNLLKELCDLQYVLSGFAAAFGLPLEEAFRLVHESNMTKLGPDGKPVYREDHKVIKGPNYRAPDLKPLVKKYLLAHNV